MQSAASYLWDRIRGGGRAWGEQFPGFGNLMQLPSPKNFPQTTTNKVVNLLEIAHSELGLHCLSNKKIIIKVEIVPVLVKVKKSMWMDKGNAKDLL